MLCVIRIILLHVLYVPQDVSVRKTPVRNALSTGKDVPDSGYVCYVILHYGMCLNIQAIIHF